MADRPQRPAPRSPTRTRGRPGSTSASRLARADAAGAEPAVRHRRRRAPSGWTRRVMAAVHWTHWEDLRNVYGVGADGYARNAVGQRRRPVRPPGAARRPHHPARVPRPQREVGHVEGARGHGPGGPPVPARLRRPSTPGARATCASARTAAPPRRRAAAATSSAMRNAYRKGLYFDGDIDIPIIDVRPYLEERSTCTTRTSPSPPGSACSTATATPPTRSIWFSGPEGGTR